MANNNPLGYPTDLGVQDFTVNLDYRVENRINIAGPSPNAVYGLGNWVTVLNGTLYSTDGSGTDTAINGSYRIDASIGTRGINQDLPGLQSGRLDVYPLQITVTNLGTTDLTFNDLSLDFILQNPSTCVFNPKNVVTNITVTKVGVTENVLVGSGTSSPVTTTSAFYSYPLRFTDGSGNVYNLPPTVTALTPSEINNLKTSSTLSDIIPFLANLPTTKATIHHLKTYPQYIQGTGSIGPTLVSIKVPVGSDTVVAFPYVVAVNLQGTYIGSI